MEKKTTFKTAPKLLPVKLLKKYCTEAGVTHLKEATIELPVKEAQAVVEKGIAVRNDKFE
jgi:hypothetical protein